MENKSHYGKRVIYSRKNSREEKLKQNKEWRKRRKLREKQGKSVETMTRQGQQAIAVTRGATASARRKSSSPSPKRSVFPEGKEVQVNSAENVARPEANAGAIIGASLLQEKPSAPGAGPKCIASPKDVKQSCFSVPIRQKPTEKLLDMKTGTRGALMLQMARGASVVVTKHVHPPQPRQPVTVNNNWNCGGIKRQRAIEENKKDLKELKPEHLKYFSADPIGSGSYGECFGAHYRGIDVLVKKFKHNSSNGDKERARKNLIHEAQVIKALGDHARLPMIFGVVTESEPLCLVTQFHGVNGHSVTLHQAANTNTLTPPECTEIFLEICVALRHVHTRGYLHNDIKANNVVLERESGSEKYKPFLIDFGKSTKVAGVVSLSSKQMTKIIAPNHGKSYLAPEVLEERRYSTASDVYSLGRMLKAITAIVGFYPSVRPLVKEATSETPSLRPHIDDFMQKLSAVKL